jgi:hypothetical protein
MNGRSALVHGQPPRMATKLLLRELKDTSYPIIHIDPDYYSLTEDLSRLKRDDDPFSKSDPGVPFLKKTLQYPQINARKIRFANKVLVAENVNIDLNDEDENGRVFAALKIETMEADAEKAYILYDISDSLPENMMYHPIAVLKDFDSKGLKFTTDGKVVITRVSDNSSRFYYYGMGDGAGENLVLPGRVKESRLYEKHFKFASIFNDSSMNDESTIRAIECVTTNGICKCPSNNLSLSVSLNLTRARAMNESTALALNFDGFVSENAVYDRLISSASRQAAILCGMSTAEFSQKYGNNAYDPFTELSLISQITDTELYAERHVCIAWCLLFVYYTNKIGLPADFESARYHFRSKVLGMIADDKGWITTTSVDLEINTHVLENVLYHLLYRLSVPTVAESDMKKFTEVLRTQIKAINVTKTTLKPHVLEDDEFRLAKQFTFQINHYDKIFEGLKIPVADVQSLATTIENKPYYCGAYAAEVDRIAKAYATSEIACVPRYENDKFKGYECKTGNVSLDKPPPLGPGDHPHPVAEYFNSGVVVILAELLRNGHTVRVVPYLQQVAADNTANANKMPWPLSPAMEITFASGRKHYEPAKILWLDYQKLYLATDSSGPKSPVVFAHSLIARAKILGYLPAIALVKTTATGEVTVERSHDASEPPMAIITVLSSGLIKVAATLYREEISNEDTADTEDAKRATSRILSEFSGFCPTTWTDQGRGSVDPEDLCYMMERICLGMSPEDAAKGLAENKTNFKRVLTEKKLFGIPE